MATERRMCWRNCAMETDAEMLEIDALEDRIGPVDAVTTKVRELISTLELCHHKAERWVESIIEAIGTGKTEKGLGTRPPGQTHPAETVWRNACAALSAWCAGCPAEAVEVTVGRCGPHASPRRPFRPGRAIACEGVASPAGDREN